MIHCPRKSASFHELIELDDSDSADSVVCVGEVAGKGPTRFGNEVVFLREVIRTPNNSQSVNGTKGKENSKNSNCRASSYVPFLSNGCVHFEPGQYLSEAREGTGGRLR